MLTKTNLCKVYKLKLLIPSISNISKTVSSLLIFLFSVDHCTVHVTCFEKWTL